MFARPLPHSKAVWVGIIGAPLLLDYWCDLGEPDSDTLTECVRMWFHTDTTAGRAVFTVVVAGGAAWLHKHILKEIANP